MSVSRGVSTNFWGAPDPVFGAFGTAGRAMLAAREVLLDHRRLALVPHRLAILASRNTFRGLPLPFASGAPHASHLRSMPQV